MLEYVLEKMVNLLPSHVTSDYVFEHVLANTIIENKLIKSYIPYLQYDIRVYKAKCQEIRKCIICQLFLGRISSSIM